MNRSFRLAALAATSVMVACTSTPTQQALLTTSVRISVRHFITDSPRSAERLHNIHSVVTKLRDVVQTETRLPLLFKVVTDEIDSFGLSQIERDDALDFLTLLEAVLDEQLGGELTDSERTVKIGEFLTLILNSLPVVPV